MKNALSRIIGGIGAIMILCSIICLGGLESVDVSNGFGLMIKIGLFLTALCICGSLLIVGSRKLRGEPIFDDEDEYDY